MPANEFWHYSKYVLALNIVSIVFYWIMLFFEKKDYEQED